MPSRAPLELLYRREAQRDLDDLFDFIATTVHILAVSYRSRDLSAFFAGRRP